MGFFTICRGSISTEGKGRFHCKSVFCIQSFVKKIISWKHVERVVNYAHRIPEVFEGEWLWRLTPIAAGHAAKSIPSFTRRSADSRRKSRQIEAEGPRLA